MTVPRYLRVAGISLVAVACAAGVGVPLAASSDGSAGAAASAATVRITLKEFTLRPSPSSVPAGRTTFVVRNAGRLEHEVVVIRTGTRAGKLPVSGSKARERGTVAEAEDVAPGATRRLGVTLRAGHYALICNISGHYKAGQFADFTVR
jgi:uncharacterized cupredoxin-like copper-binding protein